MNSNSIQSHTASESYTDLAGLNAITGLAATDKNQALDEIAKQFESMMVRMMMKSMRSANESFAEGNMLSSHAGDTYQEMYDDQLALSLSKDRGIGVAEVMVRQLQDRFGEQSTEDTNSESKGLSNYDDRRINALVSSPLSVLSSSKEKDAQKISTNNLEVGIAEPEKLAAEDLLPENEAFVFDGSVDSFITQMYPLAKSAADKLGIDPEVLIAQSALETGWGKKISTEQGRSSFNLFNIKTGGQWQGDSVQVSTLEYREGAMVKENAHFRAYQTPQQSFDDYVDFVHQNPRYTKAVGAEDNESYIQALSEAGYATDPEYANKIMRIYRSEPLQSVAASMARSAYSL